MKELTVYISKNAYAYEGTYTKIGQVSFIKDQEQLVFGAALVDLIEHKKYKLIKAYCTNEMHKLYSFMTTPFTELLSKIIKSNYAKVITEPMDLALLESKIEV